MWCVCCMCAVAFLLCLLNMCCVFCMQVIYATFLPCLLQVCCVCCMTVSATFLLYLLHACSACRMSVSPAFLLCLLHVCCVRCIHVVSIYFFFSICGVFVACGFCPLHNYYVCWMFVVCCARCLWVVFDTSVLCVLQVHWISCMSVVLFSLNAGVQNSLLQVTYKCNKC